LLIKFGIYPNRNHTHVKAELRTASLKLVSLITIGFLGLLEVANCNKTSALTSQHTNDLITKLSTSSLRGGLSFISDIFHDIWLDVSLLIIEFFKFFIYVISPVEFNRQFGHANGFAQKCD